ncbi:MAG: hypothetical protein N838_07270 [Thiohalocapsa sp. PB-PSB1]|nr:MAG: hypothetical protein N838_07270 [Thiohalocapsa sp. PB-PSB1]
MLSIGLGTGCGRVKEDKMATALYVATKGYRESIRWGYFDAAAGFLHPDQRADLDMKALENVRVTGYEVIQPAVITPQETAVQRVRIEYVLEDEQRLKSLMDRQEWRWDEERVAWWLYTGLPEFGD